ncbi:type 1 glutamine amidotransferase domain-containing protein [Streptomyces otsuchiensis]|uniref:type 1 glutamine amidotransferase domain-containing protein n=1 Tax=Streptomyces otsuchiensis TaxID=2681388 RepID=UPI00102F7F8F|nr:type 1 glutamine amidotransferase domain-containing protein [Streptomyces otsuchiensis]
MPEETRPRVLIITSNVGVERDELLVPRDNLRERGAEVTHAAEEPKAVQTFLHDSDKDVTVQPDTILAKVDANAYDVLVVPGGTVNADNLRVTGEAVSLVRRFATAGKPVAAICHAPWLLVEAKLLPGKTLTSFHSLRTDITNAGGSWVDRPLVRCGENGWALLTSRDPGDLGDFCEGIAKEVGLSA